MNTAGQEENGKRNLANLLYYKKYCGNDIDQRLKIVIPWARLKKWCQRILKISHVQEALWETGIISELRG